MGATDWKTDKNSAGLNSDETFSKRRFFVLPGLKAQLIFWPLMVIGLALDLASKSAVFTWLEQKPGNRVSIIDGFLQLVRTVGPSQNWFTLLWGFLLLVFVGIFGTEFLMMAWCGTLLMWCTGQVDIGRHLISQTVCCVLALHC